MMSKELVQCTEDMLLAAQSGKISLDAQIRAYDLLDKLLDASCAGLMGPAEAFCEQYYSIESELKSAFDQEGLHAEAQRRVTPLVNALEAAAEKVRRLTVLHDTANETFEIWQSRGFFERNRALRHLRSLAGFRLESERIGNYVAKTFDLMNEASLECARAQQALFAANVSYKIKPGIYSKLAVLLGQAVKD